MTTLSTTQQIHTVTLPVVQAAPLAARRELLVRMFAESPTKELAAVYPILLQDIFGFGGRPGWNLQLVTRKCHPKEFDQLRALLEPNGPLFSLIYRMMAELHTAFEFPASCLPSQQPSFSTALSGGLPSPLSAGSPAAVPSWAAPFSPPLPALSLNAFELYLHHFCYFLLNGAQQAAPIAWTSPGDALYPTLLEDLMNYFLPLSGHWVPPLSSGSVHPHPASSLTPDRRQLATPPRLLLRSSLLRAPGSPSSPAPPAAAAAGHIAPETWRSEALLKALATFWLESGPRPGSFAAPNDSFSTSRLILSELGTRIPSHDHVRVVRMLVKHMHFFAHSPHALPALGEFKRQAQAMLQKKLYGFIRHAFLHWPSDTSFRLVLETWLSYIQPWRYTDPQYRNRSPGAVTKETERGVEPGWGRFVAENLLFYTAVFRQVLPRLHKMDLSVPRYAYMVFRLAKVLCQPGLAPLIRDAEAALGDSRWHPKHQPSRTDAPVMYAASVGQHIIDLEETGYAYKSMFDATCRQQVHTLVCLLAEAVAAVRGTVTQLRTPPPPPEGGRSLWSGLVSALSGRSAEVACGQYSADEMSRGVSHLDNALHLLAELYELPLPEAPSAASFADSPQTPAGQQWPRVAATPGLAGGLTPSALQSPGPGRRGAPESVLTPEGPRLTARGRRQLITGQARAQVVYQGDPDRLPVQSCESALLVSLTLALSQHINDNYGPTLAALYSRRDLVGYASRQLLHAPATYYHTVRQPGGLSTRQPLHRPAGVRLRAAADGRCVALVALLLLALVLAAGLSVVTSLLVLLSLPLLWAFVSGGAHMLSDRWQGVSAPHRDDAVVDPDQDLPTTPHHD